jgi:purine-binding chemotaxis protein CheW
MTTATGAPPSLAGTGPEPPPPDEPRPDAGLFVLRVGDAHYAFPVNVVRRVLRAPRLSRLPNPTRGTLGVFALRGFVVPLLDLGILLHDVPAGRDGPVVVLRDPATAESVGMLVDEATGLVERDAAVLRPLPDEATASLPPGWAVAMALFADEHFATLLDPVALLSDMTRHIPDGSAGTDPSKETG